VTANKTPADRALDALVYAPLGLALEARELVPRLAERGRQELTSQVTMARAVGRFAVELGRNKAGEGLGKVQDQALSALTDLGLWPQPEPNGSSAHTAASTQNSRGSVAEPARLRDRVAGSPAATTVAHDFARDRADGSGGDADALAIPDYDSLAASQVVPRLDGLDADELEAVRQYEHAHRGRKTILGKIAQLQAG
jgi:hypothetical protein